MALDENQGFFVIYLTTKFKFLPRRKVYAMLRLLHKGVTIVENSTQANINWISDLLVKALCGAATILLGVAVSSLNSMNVEIKNLNKSINDLSSQSSVIVTTIGVMGKRLDKIENDSETMRLKMVDDSARLKILEQRR